MVIVFHWTHADGSGIVYKYVQRPEVLFDFLDRRLDLFAHRHIGFEGGVPGR